MMARRAPLPPPDLMRRVGAPSAESPGNGLPREPGAIGWADTDRPGDVYLRVGRRVADTIRASLPQEWEFAGRRILDFGAGAGRVARHFLAEAEHNEILACDIDARSVDWMQERLCPPLMAFPCREDPPLNLEPEALDLIYAASVYTHLTRWSAWLLEHHRLLKPGGLLWASFIGPRTAAQAHGFEGWDAQTEGIAVRKQLTSWEDGGPVVAHAPWWLRRHWGRVFEVLLLLEDGLAGRPGQGQGFVLLRRREIHLEAEALERPESPDQRSNSAQGMRRSQPEGANVAPNRS